MFSYQRQAEVSRRLLMASPSWQAIAESTDLADGEMLGMILDAAAQFAEGVIDPLAASADRDGCKVELGRVRTPGGFQSAWRDLCANGWLGLDLPAHAGGQGLPVALHTAAQMLFDRACLSFVMLAGSTRSGVFVLDAFGDDRVRSEWLPALVSGERSVTICISEPDAGSDVGRIRCRAELDAVGRWTIAGQKCWISYGDHDLTDEIGHLVLARTDRPETGTRGLSLFLVSNKDGQGENRVRLERIEEKLGLHGSPTCVLAFEGAEAKLIGEINRGLPQLFVMIERMRLLTAGMGAGTGIAALDIAEHYALERRQGGAPDRPAVPILRHADVQRQIGTMAAKGWVTLAFVLELACIIDASEDGSEDAQALAAWLLPIAKNFASETGFDLASRAIQVLGGAGYTREWPAERLLRDTRILSIFEGTTAMQAMDLLYRRLWKEEGRGFFLFRKAAEREMVLARDTKLAEHLRKLLVRLDVLTDLFSGMKDERHRADLGADAFFRAAWAGVLGWMSLRLVRFGEGPRDDLDRYLAAAGHFAMHEAEAVMADAEARVAIPEHALEEMVNYLERAR